jgi:hypothetical protein
VVPVGRVFLRDGRGEGGEKREERRGRRGKRGEGERGVLLFCMTSVSEGRWCLAGL